MHEFEFAFQFHSHCCYSLHQMNIGTIYNTSIAIVKTYLLYQHSINTSRIRVSVHSALNQSVTPLRICLRSKHNIYRFREKYFSQKNRIYMQRNMLCFTYNTNIIIYNNILAINIIDLHNVFFHMY